MTRRMAKKVLLIGWDAADWKVITPLLDSGRMPALESLVNNGVMGNLATLDPPMSPILWTSIATGMHADKHGIVNFTEPAPHGRGIRPSMITSRKVKAVWNILTQSGMKTHVVGWWPSHPAEPVNGVMISNFYQRAHSPINKPWPMPPGTVHPAEKALIFDELRVHPAELTAAHILPFVPRAAEIDQAKEKRLQSLAAILADCASIHAAATWILENEAWDFTAVYYDAIDHFSHGFMNFHPPKLKHVNAERFERYKGVVTGGYLFHDMMLGRLLQLAGDDATVILVSDHGFHSDHLRPKGIPKEPAGPAWQHRPYGIFVMKGPGIRKDERIYGVGLLDVTPTILTLLGLPVGKDMDGRPLVQAFENPIIPETIPSWEQVEGACGMHPPDLKSDPYAEQEAMDQLIALGYVEKPGKNVQKAVEKTLNESNFYLARVHIQKKRHELALPLLENLFAKHPEQVRYGFQLAKCYQALDRLADCRRVIEAMLKSQKKKYPQFDLLRGTLALAEGKTLEALDNLLKAEKSDPRLPTLHQQIGRTYLKMGRIPDAEKAYAKALEIDPESPVAQHGMAVVCMKKKANQDAAMHALNAVGLMHQYPRAHYTLGLALARLGDFERSAQALEVCLSMAPSFRAARKILIRIYKRRLNKPGQAAAHAKALAETRRKSSRPKPGIP